MHSLRSSARKIAWYDNDNPESRTYNFFGRPGRGRASRQNSDLEGGKNRLGHVQSENDARSPIENTRQAGWVRNQDSYRGSKRAGTFPEGPSSDRPVTGPAAEGDLHDIEEKEKDSNSSHDTAITSPVLTGLDNNAANKQNTRKRRFGFLHLGHKKNGAEDDGALSRQTTNKSSKSKRKSSKLTITGQLKVVLMSWINVLLIFVPIGLAFEYANLSGPATFVMNFIAIIPLAAMLSFATEELAHYVGDTFGGLLNASFGNATELIVSIIALTQGQIVIVQTSLIGSMLSNLLLVLGMCFLFGGVNRLQQFFNITVAQTAASLLALAIGALVTPTAFRIFSDNDAGVTPTSRAAAILLLLTYICYLFFQLRTHTEMYNEPSQKSAKQNLVRNTKPNENDTQKSVAVTGAQGAAAAGGIINQDNLVQERRADNESDASEDDAEQGEEPQLSKWFALGVLAASTALIAVTSDGMVSAIDSITVPDGPLSEEFVGLILIPIVGNAAEHATAVTVAIKDKMDLAIGVAVGSSLQIALLIIPVMVLFSWFGVGQSVIVDGAPAVLNLNFDGFQVVVLFIAIILVNYVIQDGRSHWLEGVMLCVTYIIFAVAAWYYPATTAPTT